MTEVTKIKVGEVKPAQTLEDFEALLVAYEKQNPVMFKIKTENGEFDRYRAKHFGKVAEKKAPEAKELKGKK